MVQRCLGLLAVCLILTGCVMPTLPPMPPTPSATQVDTPPQSPPQRPPASDAITLAYGETTTISDGGLTLTFADVLEDSRCPSDVLCAWSGWVRIQLMAQPANETATAVGITSFTDSQGNTFAPTGNQEAQPFAEVGNYLIELKQVSP